MSAAEINNGKQQKASRKILTHEQIDKFHHDGFLNAGPVPGSHMWGEHIAYVTAQAQFLEVEQ